MDIKELCLIATQPTLAQDTIEKLSDVPPRHQSVLDRDCPILSRSPWTVSIGSSQQGGIRHKLYGVYAEQLNQMPWLANWLQQRSSLTVLLVDGDHPSPYTSLQALLDTQQERLAEQPLAVLICAQQQPDAQEIACAYAMLRRHGLYGTVEWSYPEEQSLQQALESLNTPPQTTHLAA